MADKIDSKQVGLELAIIFGDYLFDTRDLHYGLFSDGLEAKPSNIAEAQRTRTI